MSPTRISNDLRQAVRDRAGRRCEYCLLREGHGFLPHEPDHIIAEKHGGPASFENLALACFQCNRFKGSDIASIDTDTGTLVPLFNPRTEEWREHFALKLGKIIPLSGRGRVTVKLLKLNRPERVEVRNTLVDLGQYP